MQYKNSSNSLKTSRKSRDCAAKTASGVLYEHYRYTAFGEVTIYDENGAQVTTTQIDNHILWNTRRRDEVTGYYLYKFRHYSAELGRWPSRDPIEERGGVNLYAFVGNNGINYWDELGRQPLPLPGSPILLPIYLLWECDCTVDGECTNFNHPELDCCKGDGVGFSSATGFTKAAAKSIATLIAEEKAAIDCAEKSNFSGCSIIYGNTDCTCKRVFGFNPYPFLPHDPRNPNPLSDPNSPFTPNERPGDLEWPVLPDVPEKPADPNNPNLPPVIPGP